MTKTFSESNPVVKQCTALLALAATLTACGGGGGDAAAPAPSTDTPAPTTPVAPPPAGPAPATFKVGGTATGLDGTVVLRTNSGETVSVTSTGAVAAFEFPTAVAPGFAYSVAVATLPNKQNCVVTNGQGTVATADVVGINLACTTRGWTIGQQLDGDDTTVNVFDAGIDQEGRVVAALVKGTGANAKIYGLRGTPGASGVVPQWSAPVRIDTDATAFWDSSSFTIRNLSLAVAPNGNAHLAWIHEAACGTQTWRLSSSVASCKYLYSAVYSAASDAWSAPLLVGDVPATAAIFTRPTAFINQRGDVAIEYQGYIQSSPPVSASASNVRAAVAWRANGQAGFQLRAFSDLTTENHRVVLDNAGGLVIASDRVQGGSSNRDIVTYAGSVASGFGATDGAVLDALGNDASLRGLSIGTTNDILVTWNQNDAAGSKVFAASKTNAADPWSVPVAIVNQTTEGIGFVTDSGDALFYASCIGTTRPKATGTWAPKAPELPSNCTFSNSDSVFGGDGSYLSLAANGAWITYSQATNAMSRAAGATLGQPDYLLGFSKLWGRQPKTLFVKQADGNYVGAHLDIEQYDTLPTPAAASGDGRSGVLNLWGFYFK